MAFISSGYNPAKPMEGRITDIGPHKYDEYFPSASGCTTKFLSPAC